MDKDLPDHPFLRLPLRHYGMALRDDFLSRVLAQAELVQARDRDDYVEREYSLLSFVAERGAASYTALRELAYRLEGTWPGHGPGPLRMISDVLAEMSRRGGMRQSDWTDRILSLLRLR